MPDRDKFRVALSDSAKDHSHRFADLVAYLEATGWRLRIKGRHHILTRPGVPFLLNLQPEKDGKAKGYQVRQVRTALARLNL